MSTEPKETPESTAKNLVSELLKHCNAFIAERDISNALKAAERRGEDKVKNTLAARAVVEALKQARKEGAEAMRERAAKAAEEAGYAYTALGRRHIVRDIRALPLE